jgi:hypothetical protein
MSATAIGQRALGWLLAGLGIAAGAQGQVVATHSVDAGGGRSQAANGVVLTGTVGQFDAGVLTASSGRLQGGFWNVANPAVAVSSLELPDLDFGNVRVGEQASQWLLISNRGSAPFTVHGIALRGAAAAEFALGADGCSGSSLPAGASCQTAILFAPLTRGHRVAEVVVSSGALGSPDTFIVQGRGTAPELAGPLEALDFGAVAISGMELRSRSLTNAGDAPLVVTQIEIVSADTDFGLADDGCSGTTLQPSASCSYQLSFSPQATGPRNALLRIHSDAAGAPHGYALAGTGLRALLQTSAASLEFGDVGVGERSERQTVVVSNLGDAPAQLQAVSVSGSEFEVVADACSTVVLAPAASCALGIELVPQLIGARGALLEILSEPAGEPLGVALAGRGVDGLAVADPAAVEFNSVPIGEVADRSVLVSNHGNQPLLFGAAVVSGSASIELVEDACSGAALAPASVCQLRLRFAPEALGQQAASLTLPNDSVAGLLSVPLSGLGIGATRVELAVSIDDGVRVVSPGDLLLYEIRLSNDGPADAIGARLRSEPDPGLTGLSWSCGGVFGATCSIASGTDAPDLLVNVPQDGEIHLVVAASVADEFEGGELVHEVEAFPPDGLTDGNPADNLAADVNVGVLIFADGLEAPAVPEPFNAALPTLSSKQLAALPQDGAWHTLRRAGIPGRQTLLQARRTEHGAALRLLSEDPEGWRLQRLPVAHEAIGSGAVSTSVEASVGRRSDHPAGTAQDR